MSKTTPRVPAGFHTVTPHLVVRGAAKAIDFYKKAFGAQELFRNHGPDGKSIMHAQIRIGDSIIMLHDEFQEVGMSSPSALGGATATMHLYVDDADALFNQAVAAGCTVDLPIQDMFWGDRYGQVYDPFGHHWAIAHKLENLTPEEMRRRAAEVFKD